MLGSRRRGDEAGTHVLEAVIVASIMLTSAVFVVSFDLPPGESDGARSVLGQRVRDALAILNDTPVANSTYGTNQLSVFTMQCLQGDCDQLSTKLGQLMPLGSRYALYFSTPEGIFPIYAPVEPAGEAVTASRLMEPAWSYQFLASSQSVFNPVEDPLVVYGLPVFSGSPVLQGGSPLRIQVEGNRSSDASVYIMKGSAVTRSVAPGDEPTAAAISVYFHSGDGTALADHDVRASTINGTLFPTGAPVPFYVRINESGGGNVPAGTTLHVDLPQGWTASASSAVNAENWTILANATDRNASAGSSSILARLTPTISNGFVDLVFNATYAGDANDYYPFTAALAGGVYAKGALLVRADAHATRSAYEVPTVLVSVPRPLGAPGVTTWTLAASSSETVNVTRIEILEEEGRNIFAGVAGVTGGGSWSTDGGRLVWSGATQISHESPLALTFSVTSAGIHGPSVERAPFTPSVNFGNHSGRLDAQTSPGLHRGVFLPASATYRGYDPNITAGVRGNHTLASDAVYETTGLPGTLGYSVAAVSGLKDSVFGSAVTVGQRTVTPGQDVAVSVEVQSVMYELAQLGLEPTVNLRVYPPWAGDSRETYHEAMLYNGTLAKGNGTFLSLIDSNADLLVNDVSTVGRLVSSVPVAKRSLYGPYVVEVEVRWFETIGVPPVSESLFRSARVYDYFVVKPTAGELLSSPVYDIHLVAWAGDWG